MQSLEEYSRVSAKRKVAPQVLGNLADFKLMAKPAELSDYDAQPMINIYSSVQGRDLGGVATDVRKIIAGIPLAVASRNRDSDLARPS